MTVRLIHDAIIGKVDGEVVVNHPAPDRELVSISASEGYPWLDDIKGHVVLNGFRVRNPCRLYSGDRIAVEDLVLDVSVAWETVDRAQLPLFDTGAMPKVTAPVSEAPDVPDDTDDTAAASTINTTVRGTRSPPDRRPGRRPFLGPLLLGLMIGVIVTAGVAAWFLRDERAVMAREMARIEAIRDAEREAMTARARELETKPPAQDFVPGVEEVPGDPAKVATADPATGNAVARASNPAGAALPASTTDDRSTQIDEPQAPVPVSRPDVIALIDRAESLLRDGLISAPPQGNALGVLKAVLAIDPQNGRARGLLDQSIARLVEATDSAIGAGMTSQAATLLEVIRDLDPVRARALERRLEAARSAGGLESRRWESAR